MTTDPLETALASLTPAATVNRDRLMYEAGRSAGGRAVRLWRGATAAGTATAAGLLAVTFARPPAVEVRTETVYVDRVAPPAVPVESPAAPDLARWLQLRDAVLADGVAALPPAPPPAGSPVTVHGYSDWPTN